MPAVHADIWGAHDGAGRRRLQHHQCRALLGLRDRPHPWYALATSYPCSRNTVLGTVVALAGRKALLPHVMNMVPMQFCGGKTVLRKCFDILGAFSVSRE